jgi:hypothetical protein
MDGSAPGGFVRPAVANADDVLSDVKIHHSV